VGVIFWLIQVIDLLMRDVRDFDSHTHKLTWFLVLVTGSLIGAIWYSVWKRQVSTVTGAKQALKPKELVRLESTQGVRRKDLHKRRRKMRSGGKISHPEHATANLGDIWHRVLLNTESRAKAARNVAFID